MCREVSEGTAWQSFARKMLLVQNSFHISEMTGFYPYRETLARVWTTLATRARCERFHLDVSATQMSEACMRGRDSSSKEHQGANSNEITPHEMYGRCVARGKEIATIPFRQQMAFHLEHLLFLFPLFIRTDLSVFEVLTKAHYPFNFPIAQPQAPSVSEWRYRTLLEHLRKQKDRELQWLLVARWLKQEQVCEPRQFLPPDTLRHLVKRFQRKMRASEQDMFYNKLIENWLPYFKRLQEDLEKRKDLSRKREEVTKLGYDADTVTWATRKRSLIEAVCGWLARQKNTGSARTLRNAYTRIHGSIRLPRPM